MAEVLWLKANGWMPTTPTCRCCSIAAPYRPGEDSAANFEALFERNGWPPEWRNGVYPFHHYHSTAHEVLGFAAGHARLILGGPNGQEIEVSAGDVALLPAGAGRVPARRTAAASGGRCLSAGPERRPAARRTLRGAACAHRQPAVPERRSRRRCKRRAHHALAPSRRQVAGAADQRSSTRTCGQSMAFSVATRKTAENVPRLILLATDAFVSGRPSLDEVPGEIVVRHISPLQLGLDEPLGSLGPLLLAVPGHVPLTWRTGLAVEVGVPAGYAAERYGRWSRGREG